MNKISASRYFCSTMNWIILIIAGLFEVGFAACLAKVKETNGTTSTLWFAGFIACLCISMYLLYKAAQSLPISYCLCGVDRHRSHRNSISRHFNF